MAKLIVARAADQIRGETKEVSNNISRHLIIRTKLTFPIGLVFGFMNVPLPKVGAKHVTITFSEAACM